MLPAMLPAVLPSLLPSADQLLAFYQSPRGSARLTAMQNQAALLLGEQKVACALGLGFPFPLMPLLEQRAEVALSACSAPIGPLAWTDRAGYNRAFLSEPRHLPIADASVDLALVLHQLEYAPYRQEVLRELWRVLVPKGRLLAVLPNRFSPQAVLGERFTPWGARLLINASLFEVNALSGLFAKRWVQPFSPCWMLLAVKRSSPPGVRNSASWSLRHAFRTSPQAQ